MKPKKFLIFDAGPFISLAMNGLIDIIEKLKQNFDGEFIITPDVRREVIEKPLKIKKYELEGVRMKNLLEKGVLKLSSDYISNNILEKEKKLIMNSANSMFIAKGEKIELIQEGEASCLAFSRLCKCDNVIVIDERTTRMLTEAPQNIKRLMEKKLHVKLKLITDNSKLFKNIKFIRSAELLYVAYKKNLFDLKKDKTLLDALLYGVKYKGTAISSREIEEMKAMA